MVSSITNDRSFTDDGCDQPSMSMSMSSSSHHEPLHASSSSLLIPDLMMSPGRSSPHSDRYAQHQQETPQEVPFNSSSSRVFGCSNTRTICGIKVDSSSNVTSLHSRSCASPGASIDFGDSAFSPVNYSPATASQSASIDTSISTHMSASISMNGSIVSHNSSSQGQQQPFSANNNGWNYETKLARSQERRRRLEGRCQRERCKRRSIEDDRDHVMNFVKGLLFGIEKDEVSERSSGSRRSGRSSSQHSSVRTQSAIREFLIDFEERMQEKGDQDISYRSYDSDNEDDIHSYYPPNEEQDEEEEEPTEDNDIDISMNLQDIEVQRKAFERIEADSARKLRMSLEHKELELICPPSPTPTESEYSSDSSYDESEAEDEFPELPVKFRSIEELLDGDKEEDDDDVTEDTSIFSGSSASGRESRSEEVEKQKEELKQLQERFDKSTQDHYSEIDAMERRFRDESLKREDLLERTLSYAETVETKIKEVSTQQKTLEETIGAMRTKHQEALRQQKEKVEQDCAAIFAQKMETLTAYHQEELKQQAANITEEELARENERMSKALRDRDAMIEKLQAESLQKNTELENLQQSTAVHESKIETLRKQRTKKGKELKKALKSLNSSSQSVRKLEIKEELRHEVTEEIAAANATAAASAKNLIRQLQAQLQERDACIEELEEDLEAAIQTRRSASEENRDTVAKLQKNLRERDFEMATLRKEHAQTMIAIEQGLEEEENRYTNEISRLQKRVEQKVPSTPTSPSSHSSVQELEFALRQKDSDLNKLESSYTNEMRKVHVVLEETKEKHSEDIAVLVNKMNSLYLMLNDRNEMDSSSFDSTLEDSSSKENDPIRVVKPPRWYSGPKDQTIVLSSSGSISSVSSVQLDIDKTDRTETTSPNSDDESAVEWKKKVSRGVSLLPFSLSSEEKSSRSNRSTRSRSNRSRSNRSSHSTRSQSHLLSPVLHKQQQSQSTSSSSRWSNLLGVGRKATQ